MALKRFPNAVNVSSKILGEQLKFPNGRTAPNRFLKAAMTVRFSTYSPEDPKKHGLPSEKILNVYDKWGNGQFGMILTGNVAVGPTNLEAIGNAIIFKEGDSSERRSLFTQWAQKMKQDGALAIIQLSHGGRQSSIWANRTPFGVSDIELKTDRPGIMYEKPVALTTEQVKSEVIDRFVYAAKFAYECGFDGIQIHAAHGYLLTQFTSPTTNNRTDRYGESLKNRNRVIIEIYDKIRKEILGSSGFLVGIKSNSKEWQDEGTTVEDAKVFCEAYEKRKFDFVELTGGTAEKFKFEHERESTKIREAFFVEFAETIRPVFKNTVVYLTGGFRTVGAMVDAVQRNTTQGIGLGRPSTAEPDLPKKILNGSVLSAVQDAFNPNDLIKQMLSGLFEVSQDQSSQSSQSSQKVNNKQMLASGSQLEQMGRNSVKKAGGNVMDQISDYSDEKVVEVFNGRTMEMYGRMQKDAMAGKAPKMLVVMD